MFEEDAIQLADKVAAKNALRLINESTIVYDGGLLTTSIAGERCTIYSGWTIYITHPKLGKRILILGGVNHRVWGTKRGRAEIAQGKPITTTWDPAPGVMFPAHVELSNFLITNAFKHRTTDQDDEIRVAIKNKG